MTIAEKHSDEIIRLYCEEKLSAKKVAAKLGLNYGSVTVYLRKQGLIRKPTEGKEREEFENYVKKRYLEDLECPQKIADELGCSRGKISRFLKNNNLLRPNINYVDNPEIIEKVIKLYESPYYSARRIGDELGIYEKTIVKILKRNNIKITYKKLIDENSETSFYGVNYEEAMEYFKDHTYEETAEKFNCSKWLIWHTANRLNCINKKPNYSYNVDFFNEIDTHEKAYILGILATDGNTFKGITSLHLKYDDVDLLEDIMRLISQDKKVLFYETKGRKIATLTITNQQITDRLIELGIVPQKTFKLKVEPWMTGEFCNSVIGGMIAGDGSIGFLWDKGEMKKPMSAWVSFIGIKEICEFVADSFEKYLGIKKPKFHVAHNYEDHPTKKSIYTISFRAEQDIKKILLWIFKDSKLVMNRKFEKAKLILEEISKREQKREEQNKQCPVERKKEKNRRNSRIFRERQRIKKEIEETTKQHLSTFDKDNPLT